MIYTIFIRLFSGGIYIHTTVPLESIKADLGRIWRIGENSKKHYVASQKVDMG
jgi:hypothetical protein